MEIRDLFLAAMKAALAGDTIECDEAITAEQWQMAIQIASQHNVVPMFYQSVYACPAFLETGGAMVPMLKRTVMQAVFRQVQMTEEFKELYTGLRSMGLEPIVVKGVIVRALHPNPDHRPSGDEDFYIPEGTYDQYKAALAKCNMEVAEWDKEVEAVNHEVTFVHKNGILNIEIHKDLFDRKLAAFKGINELFQDTFEHSIMLEIDGVPVRTMNHSDHMLFLVLHAFKHFVGSGFGIRQVCDMVVYGNHYGREIGWDYLYDKCKSIHAEQFAAAIFDIGRKYLGFDWEQSGYPLLWQKIQVDSEPLLNDLIDAGIFGGSDMSRKHSSNMTMSAVAAEKEGKKGSRSVIQTIFPSAQLLEGRFPYLQKHRFLLPLAWVQRLFGYIKEIKGDKTGNNAVESLKIGNERIDLIKKYGIIR